MADVADDAQVLPVAEPQFEQRLLQRRDVLVLVDDEEAVLLAHLLGHPRLRLDHPCGSEEHILEVELAALVLQRLVHPVHGDRLLRVEYRRQCAAAHRGGVLLDGELGDLAPLDLGGDVAQGSRVELQPQGLGGVTEQPALALQDARHGSADHLWPEIAELGERRSVERPRGDSGRTELPETAAQFRRGPCGEGERHHPARGIGAGGDTVCNAVGDRPGLAGSRPGQQADGAEQGFCRNALFIVEACEQRLRRDRDRRAHQGCPSSMGPPNQSSMM